MSRGKMVYISEAAHQELKLLAASRNRPPFSATAYCCDNGFHHHTPDSSRLSQFPYLSASLEHLKICP